MRNFIHRLLSPFMSYSTRHHLARRLLGTDFLFIGAAIVLGVIVLLVLRYGSVG